ncbi:MAG: hypothetical protein U0N38_02575 [Acutalibacteraceae bacterium]
MILVDISTPMFEKTYDFYLEENISTAQIIDEVIGIIAEKEGYTFSRNDDMANLNLFDEDRRLLLNSEESLSANGIKNGSRLILV